jgi:DNA (cytosine-5)-methyltransferase 1
MTQDALFTEEAPALVRRTMKEIKAVPWNGLTAVGSFSGCGGSSLGLKAAGWRVAAAIEFIPAAAETYRANFGEESVIEADIRNVHPGDVLKRIGMARGELDLFEGSPPCASFSSAVMRESGWGEVKKYSDTKQRTDDLFYEWTRLLDGLYPRAFVAENVPGMLAGAALEEYAHKVTKELGRLGYRVSAKVLNAANYGVPQERRRLIFLGVREDVSAHTLTHPPVVTPIAHTTRQALESVDPEDPDHGPWLEDSSMVGKAVGRTWEWKRGLRDKNDCARCGEPLGVHSYRTKTVGSVKKSKAQNPTTRVKQVPVCDDGNEGIEVKDYFLLTVPDLDEPCPTLTATGSQSGAASVVHPTECRKFTPAEAKALCGFPPDFVLTGSREQRYERMGRAVPPPLYEAVGRQLAAALTWTCSGCGTEDESLRYDDGAACEPCVMASFTEAG